MTVPSTSASSPTVCKSEKLIVFSVSSVPPVNSVTAVNVGASFVPVMLNTALTLAVNAPSVTPIAKVSLTL